MSEWDELTLDDPFADAVGGNSHAAAEIDAVLSGKSSGAQGASDAVIASAFDDIAQELDGGETKYQWNVTDHDQVVRISACLSVLLWWRAK